jgi:hypothetical protein
MGVPPQVFPGGLLWVFSEVSSFRAQRGGPVKNRDAFPSPFVWISDGTVSLAFMEGTVNAFRLEMMSKLPPRGRAEFTH